MPAGALPDDWIARVYSGVELTPTRYRTRGASQVTLSAALIDQAQDLASEGMHRHGIAQALQIPRSTFYRWLSEGRDESDALDAWQSGGCKGSQPSISLVLALCAAVETGEGLCRRYISRRLLNSEDDRVVLQFAERRFPKQYSPRPGVIVDDETGEHEAEADGRGVFDALLGKLDALAGNIGGEGG